MTVLTNPELIQKFLFAGKAVLTLRSVKTDKSFTYRISVPADKKPETSTKFFVGLMNGPDNENSYTYLGMIEKTVQGVAFRLTKGSKITVEALSYKAFRYFFDQVITRKTIPDSLEIRHSGRCCRCGRHLTTPESIDTGFGPECADVVGVDWKINPSVKSASKEKETEFYDDDIEDLHSGPEFTKAWKANLLSNVIQLKRHKPHIRS